MKGKEFLYNSSKDSKLETTNKVLVEYVKYKKNNKKWAIWSLKYFLESVKQTENYTKIKILNK